MKTEVWRSQLLVIVLSIVLMTLSQNVTKAEQGTLVGGAELEIKPVARLPQALKTESSIQNGKVVMFDASHMQDPHNDCSYWMQDLKAVGYSILVNTEPLNLQTISNADVLIILVLRYNGSIFFPYTVLEAQIIKQYVSNGGGLMVLADHDGFCWYAQEIALSFGITLNADSIIKQPIFSNANFDVEHPIMAGINSVGYNWYTTITPGTASPLIWEDDGDAVAVTFNQGLGRGAIFGDCNWPLTTFNNYYWADNELLAVQTVDWLAKCESQRIRPDKATQLVKNIIGAPYLGDGVTWGGKGDDCGKWPVKRFVSPEEITTTGYSYWNNQLNTCVENGKGLDCSGLNYWSYNRAYFEGRELKASEYNNRPLFYDGATRQYFDNTTRIGKQDLIPGDLLFYNPSGEKNKSMNHVMMYVGPFTYNGLQYNVIHASGFIEQIAPASYNFDTEKVTTINSVGGKQDLKVADYGRVSDYKLDAQIIAHSPVDLVVIDPEGETIFREMRESLSMAYMSYDIDGDGEKDDIVAIPERKIGNYLIQVVPELDALPTDTYSLEFVVDGLKIVLAENVPISGIPSQPYIIRSTEEKIELVIPATVDIDPDTLNIKSAGQLITCYIELPVGYNVKEIDVNTVRLWITNTQITPEAKPTEIGDYDKDSIPDLMIKFNRSALVAILEEKNLTSGNVTLIIDGQAGSEWFGGTDTIKVIGLTKDKKSTDEGMAPMKPNEFALFQNYSNPFNPDTWMPYQLAEDIDVTIRIYDVSGKLIRTLSLGYKPAGFYTSKDKAAYWDGKNEVGERVSSGIYFYTIHAGDFMATKKMIINK